MKPTLAPTIMAVVFALPVNAMTDLDAYRMASELGNILASEAFCGLAYDQNAIADYIATNVPPERVDFSNLLTGHANLQKMVLEDLSPSTKTAHCAAVTLSARHLGFTP